MIEEKTSIKEPVFEKKDEKNVSGKIKTTNPIPI
jgi:hypothetical protein